MSRLVDALQVLLRDARRIAVSDDAEITTTTRAGVISVRVVDAGVQLLTATLDTRPRAQAPRAEQLGLPLDTSSRPSEPPAALPPSTAPGLVHLRVREEYQQRQLWRPGPDAVSPFGDAGPFIAWSREEYHWHRTVVPADLAAVLRERHPGHFDERPAGDLADHTVRVGAKVPVAESMNATHGEPAEVLDVALFHLDRVCDDGPVLCAIFGTEGAYRAADLAGARYIDHGGEGFYLVAEYPVARDAAGAWVCPDDEPPPPTKKAPRAKAPTAKKGSKKALAPGSASPAPEAPAGATGDLVELVLEQWPSPCRELDIYDATRVVLWTSQPREDVIRTIVPAGIAIVLRQRLAQVNAKVIHDGPSSGPLHLVEIGGRVGIPGGDATILGVIEGDDGPDGLALDTPDGLRAAWLDGASINEGRVELAPSSYYEVDQVAGRWVSRRKDPPPAGKKAGAKKSAARVPKTPVAAPPAPPPPTAGEPHRVRGLAVGDEITLDEDPLIVLDVDDERVVWRTAATDERGRPDDEGEFYWSEVDEVSPKVFTVRPVVAETSTQKAKRERAEKKAPSRELRDGTPIHLETKSRALLATQVLRVSDTEVEIGSPGYSITVPRSTVTCVDGLWHCSEPAERLTDLPFEPASTPAKPPRRAKVYWRDQAHPLADALVVAGEPCIVWKQHDGTAWEKVWSPMQNLGGGGPVTKAEAWTLAAQGARAREYNKRGTCVRDTADEGGAL